MLASSWHALTAWDEQLVIVRAFGLTQQHWLCLQAYEVDAATLRATKQRRRQLMLEYWAPSADEGGEMQCLHANE